MRSTGVHHVDLVVSDIGRSLAFYRGVLGPLGWHGLHEIPGEQGETIHYIHGPGSTVGLRQAPDGAASLPVDRYRVGMHHVCFEAATRELLYASARRIAELGRHASRRGRGTSPSTARATTRSSSSIPTGSSSSCHGRRRGRTTGRARRRDEVAGGPERSYAR